MAKGKHSAKTAKEWADLIQRHIREASLPGSDPVLRQQVADGIKQLKTMGNKGKFEAYRLEMLAREHTTRNVKAPPPLVGRPPGAVGAGTGVMLIGAGDPRFAPQTRSRGGMPPGRQIVPWAQAQSMRTGAAKMLEGGMPKMAAAEAGAAGPTGLLGKAFGSKPRSFGMGLILALLAGKVLGGKGKGGPEIPPEMQMQLMAQLQGAQGQGQGVNTSRTLTDMSKMLGIIKMLQNMQQMGPSQAPSLI